MRRIAIINQKGGVGKTTTTANLGAALAIQGRGVVVVDMDAQANLSLSLGIEAKSGSPTSYTALTGTTKFATAIRPTTVPNLSIVPANLDLSGAELELAAAMGREFILRDAIREWSDDAKKRTGRPPADYVLFDCPPSLGLLAINALASAGEVLITLQTEFLALQGMSKLVEVVGLLKKRLNPELVVTGIVPCLYDSRLRLAREVLAEIRTYFKGQVFPHPIRANVKLAEAPSFGQTVFEYAPDSNGADDYMRLAREVLAREGRDADLAGLPPFDETARLAPKEIAPPRPRPPPRKPATKPDASRASSAPGTATPTAPAGETRTVGSASSPPTPAAAPAATNVATSASAARPASAPTASKVPAKNANTNVPTNATTAVPTATTRASTTATTAGASGATGPGTASHGRSAPAPKPGSTPCAGPAPAAGARAPGPQPALPARDELCPAPRPSPPRAPTTRNEPRVLRAEDVPPLPPDAFEILSILPTDP